MARLNKKSQIDISIVIGAIIIPVAALVGSIMFAWLLLSPMTDLCRLAESVSYDISALTDVVFSVPDHIQLRYTGPSTCIASGNAFKCVGNRLSISPPQITQVSYLTYINYSKNINGSFPLYLRTNLPAALRDPSENRDYSYGFRFRSYANPSSTQFTDTVTYGFSTNGLIIPKKHAAYYDTIDVAHSEQNDAVLQTTQLLLSACYEGKANGTDLFKLSINNTYLPPQYKFNSSATTNTICLWWISLPDSVWHQIYCFDLDEITGTGCTYTVFGSFELFDTTYSNSIRIRLNTTYRNPSPPNTVFLIGEAL